MNKALEWISTLPSFVPEWAWTAGKWLVLLFMSWVILGTLGCLLYEYSLIRGVSKEGKDKKKGY